MEKFLTVIDGSMDAAMPTPAATAVRPRTGVAGSGHALLPVIAAVQGTGLPFAASGVDRTTATARGITPGGMPV